MRLHLAAIGDKVCAGIDIAAVSIEDLAVAAFCPSHEKYHILACRKAPQMLRPVGNLAANCIGILEHHSGGAAAFYFVNDVSEPLETFGGL